MTTLTVTVDERDRLDERTQRRIRAAQADADLDDVQPVLDFESYETLCRLFRPTNLELLEAIAQHEPDSVRETASLVDRDYKQVHHNLDELEDIGVITFEGGGSGRAKQPLLAYDRLEIDVPLTERGESSEQATS